MLEEKKLFMASLLIAAENTTVNNANHLDVRYLSSVKFFIFTE